LQLTQINLPPDRKSHNFLSRLSTAVTSEEAIMSYKSIIVFLDNSERCAQRFEFALDMALTHQAHLTGLYMVYEPAYPLVPDAGFERLAIELEEFAAVKKRQMEQTFRDGAVKAGVAAFDWRAFSGNEAALATAHVRTADLAIVGQRDAEDDETFIAEGFPELVVLGGARPTLFLPYAGVLPTSFKTVMVAWNGGREAARAIADALPLLTRAGKVVVTTVATTSDTRDMEDLPDVDVAAYLSRHGVKAEVTRSAGIDIDAGEWLLSQAADVGADLLVMGAYGHARLREFVLGGVTRTLLKSMSIPVLMSH
jgi:nucleotide-binding universal stress UspA family protein